MNGLADDSRPLLDVPTGVESGAWSARAARKRATKTLRARHDELDAETTRAARANALPGATSDASAEGTAARYRRYAVALVGVATVLRFTSMYAIPLGNGEAYYVTWSRFLNWSYFDHPPLVAWMVRVTSLLGHAPPWVRLGPILAAGAFGYLLYRLAERFMRPRAAFFALCIVTALPVFLASSFIVNPEAPLAPLRVAYLLIVESMRKRDDGWLPLAAGALLGFAFLAKYTAVLLVPATLLFAVWSPPMRRWLRRPTFYAGGALALAITSPVLWWNDVHGWASVKLHLVERTSVGVPAAGTTPSTTWWRSRRRRERASSKASRASASGRRCRTRRSSCRSWSSRSWRRCAERCATTSGTCSLPPSRGRSFCPCSRR